MLKFVKIIAICASVAAILMSVTYFVNSGIAIGEKQNMVSDNQKIELSDIDKIDESRYDLKVTTKKAILFSKKSDLNGEELKKVGEMIDDAINEIESFCGKTLDQSFGHGSKIIYYFEPGGDSGAGVYDDIPKILLGRNELYVHETAHIIAGVRSRWFSEGIADYLSMKFNKIIKGYPDYNDIYVKTFLNDEYKKIIEYIGKDNNLDLSTISYINSIISGSSEFRALYVLSGSFVKFLAENIGDDKLIIIYSLGGSSAIIEKETGKSMNEWKNAWFEKLGAKELQKDEKEQNSNWGIILLLLIACIMLVVIAVNCLRQKGKTKKEIVW